VAAQSVAAGADGVIRPHAAATTTSFSQSGGAFTLEYPSDWDAHETAGRVTIGASDGLVPTGRGFRTVYGAIVAIVDDPDAGRSDRTIERSATAIVDAILKRNPHQTLSVAVHGDRPLGGQPAAAAVLTGISPVTSRAERAEVVCRAYGPSQILYVILVSPGEAYADLAEPLQRLRDSIRVASGGRERWE